MHKTVLVTGATGFLGGHVTPALISRGYRVVAALRASSDASRLPAQALRVDIESAPLESTLRQYSVDAIVHLACDQGRAGASIQALLNSNVLFGVRLLEAACSAHVTRFLNADTQLEPGVNAYALSKKQLTQWLPHFCATLRIANLRLGNIYGPGEPANGFLAWLLNEFRRDAESIDFTPGEQLRDFVHATDVSDAMLHVLEQQAVAGYEEYDVGSGEMLSLRQFVELAHAEFSRQAGPLRARLEFGALPYRAGEVMQPRFDTSGLFALGWRPGLSTRERLEQTIRAFLQNL